MAEKRDGKREAGIDEEEIVELEETAVGSLEEAMREALAAVEEGELLPLAAEPLRDPAGLETQVAVLREKWLRSLADLENFRKRTQRERQEEQRYRGFEVFRELVGIVDNLGRALSSEGSVGDLKQGVELIRRQLESLLRDHGVERIEAVGRPFDPSWHDAVSHRIDPEVREPIVATELQPGYRMHDRLVRPAAVGVAMPPSGAGEPEGTDGSGG